MPSKTEGRGGHINKLGDYAQDGIDNNNLKSEATLGTGKLYYFEQKITQNININLIQSGMLSQTPEVTAPPHVLRNGGVQSKRYYSKSRGAHGQKRTTIAPT